MRILRRVLLGSLAGILLLGGGLVGTPIQAASPYGSVTGINGVLYDDCLSYPYAYAVPKPSGAGYWALSTKLIGPDGRKAASDYVAEPGSGTSSFGLLCPPAQGYSTYTIRATVAWGAGDVPDHSATLDDAHFTLRKPHSRTRLAASTRRPAPGQVVRYVVAAYDERPTGFTPRAFTWVHLEQRRAGRWVRVTGGRAMTHANGRVVVRLRAAGWHQRVVVRAVTERTDRFTRSTSPVLRLW